MKRLLVILIMIMLFSVNPINATSPRMPGEIEIELTDCDEGGLYDDVRIDILVNIDQIKEVDWFEYYENLDFNNLTENAAYRNSNPNYESYPFLQRNGYISYSAYVRHIEVNGYCKLYIDTALEEHHDIYIIVHKTNGVVLIDENIDIDDLGSINNGKHFGYLKYSVLDNELELKERRVYNPFLVVLFVLVVGVVGVITAFVVLVKIQKRIVSGLLTVDETKVYRDKFVAFNLVSVIVTASLFTMTLGRGIYVVIAILLLMHLIGYLSIKNYKDTSFHPIGNKRILIAQLIPFIGYMILFTVLYLMIY